MRTFGPTHKCQAQYVNKAMSLVLVCGVFMHPSRVSRCQYTVVDGVYNQSIYDLVGSIESKLDSHKANF